MVGDFCALRRRLCAPDGAQCCPSVPLGQTPSLRLGGAPQESGGGRKPSSVSKSRRGRANEYGTNSLAYDSAVSSALRGSPAPRSASEGLFRTYLRFFSVFNIRTNVPLLNLHKNRIEISLFYLNPRCNIFVAIGTLWWYN